LNIEIITTLNKKLKESGFGGLDSCNSVLKAVTKMGHDVVLNICETKADLLNIVIRKPDLVILAIKYIFLENKEKVYLSEYFSKHEINYTGSIKNVLQYDSNKILAKIHLKNRGIKTLNHFTAIPGEYKSENELPISFPLFLKPIDAANGNGIDDLSYVTSFEEFESKVLSLYKEFALPVLVEEYLEGKEYTVSVIQLNDSRLLMSHIEIVPPSSTNGLKILGYEVKTDNSEELKKITNNILKVKLTKMATDVFYGLGIRDYARVDIKTNQKGECYFMEVNLVPGMTEGSSYFPSSCEIDHKLVYSEVVTLMLSQGLKRIPGLKPVNKKIELNSNFLNKFGLQAEILNDKVNS
jgi:D-alanine-D-alanine ligase